MTTERWLNYFFHANMKLDVILLDELDEPARAVLRNVTITGTDNSGFNWDYIAGDVETNLIGFKISEVHKIHIDYEPYTIHLLLKETDDD